MKMPRISVSHTVNEDNINVTTSYFLEEPCLPDGCEECGAFRGSPFEIRLMCLIRHYEMDSEYEPFLCKKCFLKASAKENERLVAQYHAKRSS
jgi:hypothetical protein